MEIYIPDQIRNTATKCKKRFSCLESERNNLCKVEYCVGGEIHFIKCLNDESCFYQNVFGGETFCSCPVRKEIYNKYEI